MNDYAKRIAEAVIEAAADKCDEYGEITAAEKDSALLVGKVDLSIAMSGEPRAAAFLANAIRALDLDAIIASVPGPDNVPDELLDIGERLRTQDNRITDQPMFIVQQKRQIVGIDPEYLDGDQIGWFDADGMATPEEHASLEAGYQEDGQEPDGWTRTGYSNQWEFVTACFTEQGCKDYLTRDGHNLKEPRIYAEGSYRNVEYRLVRDFLLSLPTTEGKP